MSLQYPNALIINVRRYTFLICLSFIVVFIAVSLSAVYFTHNVKAHPGNTASDGCHYCRTNCDSWGEVYGERHCHGGAVEYDEPEEYYPDPEPEYDDYPEPQETPDGTVPSTGATTAPTTDTATLTPSTESSNSSNDIWNWVIGIGIVLFYPLLWLIGWLWEWVQKDEL